MRCNKTITHADPQHPTPPGITPDCHLPLQLSLPSPPHFHVAWWPSTTFFLICRSTVSEEIVWDCNPQKRYVS